MIISPSSRPKPGRTSLDSFSSIALNAHDDEDGGHIDVDGDETAIGPSLKRHLCLNCLVTSESHQTSIM